ncbi:MAG: S-methyl-5-thioribose-1-phosphate isomerase [Coriobacteriia bacterium]|nr:S-methyl-5-thioribose-1-phosphate isomerase [Coriobacteriia bacterium]
MTADLSKIPRSIWWGASEENGKPGVFLLDQTRLPLSSEVICCQRLEAVEVAIQSLAVRGAPALGVAAAMAIAVWSENESTDTETDSWLAGLDAAAERIGNARPTAVNLLGAADRVRTYAHDMARAGSSLADLKAAIVALAQTMAEENEAENRAIGKLGAELLEPGSRILTHCNAGSLGTAYFGTVGGVIYTAVEQQKIEHVWVTETRPLNQGARLTTWELMAVGVPCALIADSMAASIMDSGWVSAVFVGADRICANGDTANKVGTLALAIAADYYQVPFYVCAPTSTIDKSLADGSEVTIEQRDGRELAGFSTSGAIIPTDRATLRALDMLTSAGERNLRLNGKNRMNIYRKAGTYAFDAWFQATPPGLPIYNPAFDVTPAELITAVITETGVYPPGALPGLTD